MSYILNNIKSDVVIEMKHVDNAIQLTTALKKFKKEAAAGGDAVMYIRSNGKLISCGKVGHDVDIKKVKHTIYT